MTNISNSTSQEALEQDSTTSILPELKTKCGYVGIVGRPNVGKSTLMNTLLGQKVAITSSKPQTTRHRILGIYTEGDLQMVFCDSPGIHGKETRQMNKVMNRTASAVLNDVNLIYFVVEGTKWQDNDELVLNKLEQVKTPVILIINKVDLVNDKATLLPFMEKMQQRYPFVDIVPLSAEKKINLEGLIDISAKYLPYSEFHYDQDQVTDKGGRFMAAEFIREKLMRLVGDELPYSASVEIEIFKMKKNVIDISAVILVERAGQKKIVIGKDGEKIKRIGTEARMELQNALERKINLNLWVKVKSGWADDLRALRSLGYMED